jgi:hypothetical protein
MKFTKFLSQLNHGFSLSFIDLGQHYCFFYHNCSLKASFFLLYTSLMMIPLSILQQQFYVIFLAMPVNNDVGGR